MKITIGHLYPDLLNLYGDRGNIEVLRKRLEGRGIEACVEKFELNDEIDFEKLDIVFIGGGSDREQALVCRRLLEYKKEITDYAESGKTLIAVCGGYQLLGKYYRLGDETIEGLGILDIYTERREGRLIGNIALSSDIIGDSIVGFENHGGRTNIGSHTPLGKVIFGYGNNGKSGYEGVVYKNVYATYLHGPLLPKNPVLADFILSKTLEHKYRTDIKLLPLDDELEMKAHKFALEKLNNSHLKN